MFGAASNQDESPHSLRQALVLSRAVACRYLRVVPTLGFSKYLAEALTHHCKLNSAFVQRYQLLPFGSSIRTENLGTHLEDKAVYTIPAYDLERKTKTISCLQKLWADAHSSCIMHFQAEKLRLLGLVLFYRVCNNLSDGENFLLFEIASEDLDGSGNAIACIRVI